MHTHTCTTQAKQQVSVGLVYSSAHLSAASVLGTVLGLGSLHKQSKRCALVDLTLV